VWIRWLVIGLASRRVVVGSLGFKVLDETHVGLCGITYGKWGVLDAIDYLQTGSSLQMPSSRNGVVSLSYTVYIIASRLSYTLYIFIPNTRQIMTSFTSTTALPQHDRHPLTDIGAPQELKFHAPTSMRLSARLLALE
jgi:hypothetical protein